MLKPSSLLRCRSLCQQEPGRTIRFRLCVVLSTVVAACRHALRSHVLLDLSRSVHGLQATVSVVHGAHCRCAVADQAQSNAVPRIGHETIHSGVVRSATETLVARGERAQGADLHLHGSISQRSLSAVGLGAPVPPYAAPGDRERRTTIRDDAFNRGAERKWKATVFRVRDHVR